MAQTGQGSSAQGSGGGGPWWLPGVLLAGTPTINPNGNYVIATNTSTGVEFEYHDASQTNQLDFAYANNGGLIMGARGPALFPARLSPSFFAAMGKAANGNLAATVAALTNFGRGGIWDLQRLDGAFNSQGIDSATVAIGIYGAASGVPMNAMLDLENMVARGSTYAPVTVFSSTYTNLPARNVYNTMIRYSLFQSGLIP